MSLAFIDSIQTWPQAIAVVAVCALIAIAAWRMFDFFKTL